MALSSMLPQAPGHAPAPLPRSLVLLPGIALSAVIAAAAAFTASLYGGPVLLHALLFGIGLHHLGRDAASRPGVEFCARALLRLGVGLVGARITGQQIAELGWGTAGLVVAGVLSTLAMGVCVGRWLGFSRAKGVLAGGAVAICGASAALALSAVLPKTPHKDRDTLVVVIAVTVLSTLAMVLYPMVAQALGLSPQAAGIFLGGSIHDVAQVVGAGYTLGPEAGDTATAVKLFRVAMLTLVVAAVSWAFRNHHGAADSAQVQAAPPRRPPLVPWFLVLFVALVLLNTSAWIPASTARTLGQASQVFFVVAIAALGITTSPRELLRAGWRPLLLVLAETVWLAGLMVVGVGVLGR